MQITSESPVQGLNSRILTLFLVCSAAYLGLALRFTYLQALPHPGEPAERDQETRVIPARRGDIYDRNGIPLAITVDGFDVWVRPNLVRKLNLGAQVAPALAHTLNMPIQAIQAILSETRSFSFVKRHVSHQLGLSVRALNLQGAGADPVFLRAYPQGALGAQTIGRVTTDDVGRAGIEEGYDRILRGVDGETAYRVDGKGQPIPGTERVLKPARNGSEIRLTLDARIQEVAERELDRSVQAHHATAGCTLVVDVPTGQILAMASRPTFNPNLPVQKKDMDALLNRAISYAYEPGSTMKMVTAASALATKKWSLTDTVDCKGSIMIGRRRIRCVVEAPYHGGHGVETLRDILRNSCNVGAATVGMKLGGSDLYKYIKSFGLLDRSEIGLPGAVAYRLSRPDTWARVRLANIAFGQGIMVTPIQILYAYAAIANGGCLMKPEVVQSIVNTDAGVTRSIAPCAVRRVVSPEIARETKNLLVAVVYDGTGKNAEIPGYSIAGKTGSSQKAGAHGYIPGKYVASFIGFAPASDPRVACITMIDEPKGIHWGAVCAAPVVREVLRWSLHYLQIPPDAPELTADGSNYRSLRKQEVRLAGTGSPFASSWIRGAHSQTPTRRAAIRVSSSVESGRLSSNRRSDRGLRNSHSDRSPQYRRDPTAQEQSGRISSKPETGVIHAAAV
ncbi:MAG TPA: penicillin-binding protein 2 [Armatimonadota bacterium]|nr:penicillin-binding protein 2 [Armatimonadota bacterium]